MRKYNFGFTLVEELIVIAIMVSLLGFGAVRMMDVYRHNSIELLSKDLQTSLRFLQMKSIEDGRIYQLITAENGRHIQVKRKDASEKEFKPFHSSWVSSIQTGKQLTMEFENSDGLFFYPDGSTSKNRLFIIKENGERLSILLKNRIGTIEVKGA